MITFIIFEVIKSNEWVISHPFCHTIMIFFKIKQILFLLSLMRVIIILKQYSNYLWYLQVPIITYNEK